MHLWTNNVEWVRSCLVTCLVVVWGVSKVGAAEARVYRGCCDASASVALNDELLAVASDEENVLRLYRRDVGGLPVATATALGGSGLNPGKSEIDLEGAARLDDLVFWIGSHSRNSDGKARPARHALLATRVVGTGAAARLVPTGMPYRGLVGRCRRTRSWRDSSCRARQSARGRLLGE